jgi:Cys-rich repeat protein
MAPALLGALCLAVLAGGCANYDTGGKTAYQAPLLTGQDDARTYLDLQGTLTLGGLVEGAFSTQKPITGYVFSANPGARVTVTLTSKNGEDPVLLLYGPLSNRGLWGQAIAVDDDSRDGRNAVLDRLALTRGGRYLIGAATYDGASGGPFELALGCQGECGQPHCPPVACDLYCPAGFMTDPNGCEICRCAQVECNFDEDCWSPDGTFGRCLDGRCFYGDDQRCSDQDPTCPEGLECVLGPCPLGPCTPENCPPCEGYCRPVEPPQCFSDLDCLGPDGQLGRCLNGRCVAEAILCNQNEECPAGMACEWMCPACPPEWDRPCPECQGVCVPVGPPACDQNNPCPPGMLCAMECWGCDDPAQCPEPICRGVCVPDAFQCRTDQDCIYPDGQMGYCLNGQCVFQQIPCLDTRECPPGQECMVACLDCDPDDPTCEPGCQGFCLPVYPPQCYGDFDCRDAAGNLGRCLNGTCVFEPLRCRLDWDCPPNSRCDIVECWDNCMSPMDCCWGVCVPDGQPQCFSDFDCRAPDGQLGRCIQGYCMFDSCICPEVWSPVCGVDGRTYPNPCYADCARVPIAHWGECEGQPGDCVTDRDCPPGTYCELGITMPPMPTGVCLPLPPMECLADSDCPQGFRCEPGVCPGMPCDPDGQCPPCWGQCVPASGDCIQTGCSGEICAPYPVSSTCIWLPEYECLRYSRCELLMDAAGQRTCGWFQTPEYLACLERVQGGGGCQSDADCPPGSLCAVACQDCRPGDPTCAPGCQGTCIQPGCACPDVYDPVCGADRRTYSNVCEAYCQNVEVAYWGACR